MLSSWRTATAANSLVISGARPASTLTATSASTTANQSCRITLSKQSKTNWLEKQNCQSPFTRSSRDLNSTLHYSTSTPHDRACRPTHDTSTTDDDHRSANVIQPIDEGCVSRSCPPRLVPRLRRFLRARRAPNRDVRAGSSAASSLRYQRHWLLLE